MNRYSDDLRDRLTDLHAARDKWMRERTPGASNAITAAQAALGETVYHNGETILRLLEADSQPEARVTVLSTSVHPDGGKVVTLHMKGITP